MATQKAIGEERLKDLGLPSSQWIKASSDIRGAYRDLAQCLVAYTKGPELPRFQTRILYPALAKLRAAWPGLPASDPTSETVSEWIASIKAIQAVQAANQKEDEARKGLDAPIMLRYLSRIAQLTDFVALSSLKDDEFEKLDLIDLRQQPPSATLMASDKAILLFATRQSNKDEKQRFRIYFRANLEKHGSEGVFMPAVPPDFMPAQEAFFDRDGIPYGDYEVSDIQSILGQDWAAEHISNWQAFMAEIEARCMRLCGVPLHELPQALSGHGAKNLIVMLVDAAKARGSGLPEIYDDILTGRRKCPLLERALGPESTQASIRLSTARRDLFLGHMDERGDAPGQRHGYPLDATQRLAAMTALSMLPEGETIPIVPVNGPPGTGKTSFLRSVLASVWVRAALEGDECPPLVVGTAATNKAVSNVIEAFGTVPDLSGDVIQARWLDGLPSYGWSYPSKEAAEKFPHLMHLGWTENPKRPYFPAGGAAAFHDCSLDEKAATYVSRGKRALSLSSATEWLVGSVVDVLRRRVKEVVAQLRKEQTDFSERLALVRDSWRAARGTAFLQRDLQGIIALQERALRLDQASVDRLSRAKVAADNYLTAEDRFWKGWRGILRRALGDWLFRHEVEEIEGLSAVAENRCVEAGILWPHWPTERSALHEEIRQRLDTLTQSVTARRQHLDGQAKRLEHLAGLRSRRQSEVRTLLGMMQIPEAMPPGEKSGIRYVRAYSVSNRHEGQASAEDMLWHRFDASQDERLRFKLFHLAARYWEGRWLLAAESDAKGEAKSSTSDDLRLRRLMMLGVIVVSTTKKLPSIGKNSTIDLLIMDESGQCAPEVGAAMLSFANTAILVGDAKQLQPVSVVSVSQSEQVAKSAGLPPNVLPVGICGARGSAMGLARRAAAVTDGQEGPGVTLLYHYRCHPRIISYCNKLLYDGKIRCVRKDEATKAKLPPVSWVAVDGPAPEPIGSSWRNRAELKEIAAWIRHTHEFLVAAYGKPLSEVLAVITPLKAQALDAKEFLKQSLADIVDPGELERMTVGTVHSLQGAERPVVAFSLVQHRNVNGRLFADRDGGFLMNVAVSRAKDAFVVFAQRDTLRPAPTDKPLPPESAATPIGKFGAYLRQWGTRLYPRHLVIVEAKGKVGSIGRALGLDCLVVETNGYLKESSLQPDGSLRWSDVPKEFKEALYRQRKLIDDLVVATDDDLAGELIGMHAAEVAAEVLGQDVPVRRMRFHSVTETHLRASFSAAGDNFDANVLAAALLREALRHLDKLRFMEQLPRENYVSAPQRALVALVDEATSAAGYSIEAILADSDGKEQYRAFIPADGSALASAATLTQQEAERISAEIASETFHRISSMKVAQVPPLYPPSTTQRVLARASDELGLLPWEAQKHLNAMYEEGMQRS